MLARSISALAMLVLVAHATAQEVAKPYKPQLMKTSVQELFGAQVRRRGMDGYVPRKTRCGEGETCEEACGAGYAVCARADHCYDAGAGQLCCPDGSGNSCEAGFYCAQDKRAGTWCCPEGMSLAACAAAYTIGDGLVSATARPSTLSVAASSTGPSISAAASTAPASATSADPTSHATRIPDAALIPAKNESRACGSASSVPSAGVLASNGSSPTFAVTGTSGHGIADAVATAVPAGAGRGSAAPAGVFLALAVASAAILKVV